ncbi:hypothetical protein [Actinoplanes derwentensis]|uniref:WXG100 family type VII secretion target n=1 Tax=Actinoplanes derwentensis TaxID=113562 RepID=A0A1H2CW66_9ACTN|nr:hypothetical protein [Actinoplanes derwentensis]GID88329.1 hypothetical protein Ade03nite_72530 [Actinoplanes derwentensis]SDT74614.1 hypothetical protein SAMN04489716_7036 [Actinoplanes derwentensis]
MTTLGVDTTRLGNTQPEFTRIASAVERTRSTLETQLTRLEGCWGDDKIGKAFAGNYSEPAGTMREGLKSLVEVLGSVADGIGTMAKGADRAEQDAVELASGGAAGYASISRSTTAGEQMATATGTFSGIGATGYASISRPMTADEQMATATGTLSSEPMGHLSYTRPEAVAPLTPAEVYVSATHQSSDSPVAEAAVGAVTPESVARVERLVPSTAEQVVALRESLGGA